MDDVERAFREAHGQAVATLTRLKAITAEIGRIDETDSALGRLLRDTVLTGSSCRYDPDPMRPVRWLLDGGDR
jgi:hypothetical protein